MTWWKKKAGALIAKVEPGMTKEQVEGLLGPPQQQFTEEEYQSGRRMLGGGSLLGNEYWFYRSSPRRGLTTMITFREGCVLELAEGLG